MSRSREQRQWQTVAVRGMVVAAVLAAAPAGASPFEPDQAARVTSSSSDVLDTVMDASFEGELTPLMDRPGGERQEPRRSAFSVVPEPASLVLLGTGLAAVAGMVRRRRRASQAD